MNYYEHHIGDWAQATAHLSPLEDGIYSRMTRKYYADEKPLPVEVKAIQRLVGARTKEEKQAVEDMLGEFFQLLEDGWHQARCDAEIARYQGKRVKAQASANARWSHANASQPSNANASPDASERNANASETHNGRNAHQTPDTRHQTKEEKKRGCRLPEDWTPDGADLAFIASERPDLDPQTTAAKFADYWHGVAGAKGVKLDWPATWRNFVRTERAPLKANGHGNTTDAWWTSSDGIARKCRELRISGPRPGESNDQVRGRINEAMTHAA